jgi:hypothetical protein
MRYGNSVYVNYYLHLWITCNEHYKGLPPVG